MVWGTNLVNILPAEMLIHVGGFLTRTDLAHFVLVCRRLYMLLNKRLYKLGVEIAPLPTFEAKMVLILWRKRFNTLKMFLEAGFPLNSFRLSRKWPLLHLAVKWGRIEMVKLILAHGGDPHYTDEQISAPLTHASSPQMLEVLFNAGANANVAGAVGEMLLEDWIIYADAEMASMLLEHGADPERVPNRGLFHPAAFNLWYQLVYPRRREYFDVFFSEILEGDWS
jgi:hypothetical protein